MNDVNLLKKRQAYHHAARDNVVLVGGERVICEVFAGVQRSGRRRQQAYVQA